MATNTNGASLEDCHTNFFALAELTGIKWRRLRANNPNHANLAKNCLEDPILVSYSNCLNAGELMCAWTRYERPTSDSTLGNANQQSSATFAKELWIFWYSGEPDFSEYLSSDLSVYETGSWENGLSYECRSLLFKAFHNLIERSLLAKGYARFGKWFTQPTATNFPSSTSSLSNSASSSSSSSTSTASTTAASASISSTCNKLSQSSAAQLSFSFDFFVHGDSTVCVSVDVRQRPRIYRIGSKNVFTASQVTSTSSKVILSPYGLTGTLTGHMVKDSEPSVQKFLSDWRRFYPLFNQQTSKADQSTQSNNSRSSTGGAASSASSSSTGDDGDRKDNCPSVLEVNVAGVRIIYPSAYIFYSPDDDVSTSNCKAIESSVSSSSSSTTTASTTTTTASSSSSSKCHNATDFLLTPPNSPHSDTQSKLQTPTMSPHQSTRPQSTFLIRHAASQDIICTSDPTSPDESTEPFDWEYTGPCYKSDCNCFRCKSSKKLNVSSTSVKSSCITNKKLDKERITKKTCLPFHKRIQQIPSPLIDTIVENCNEILQGSDKSCVDDIQPTNTPSQYKSPAADGLPPSIASSVTTPGIDSPVSVQTSSSINNERPPSNKVLSNAATTSTASPFYSVKDNIITNSPLASPSLKDKCTTADQSPSNCKTNDKPSQIDESSSALSWNTNADTSTGNTVVTASVTNTVEVSPALGEQSKPVEDATIDNRVTSNSLLYDFSSVSIDLSEWLDVPRPKRRRKVPLIDGETQSTDTVQSTCKDPYEFSDGDDKQSTNSTSNTHSGNDDRNSIVLPSFPPPSGNWSCLMKDTKSLGDSISSPQTPQFTRKEDLTAHINDLDQMFETSSGEDSNDGNSNGKSQTNWSSVGPSTLELARMFPTPPSLEQHIAPSPSTAALEAALLDEANAAPCSPAFLERIRDSTDVYKPPVVCKMIAPTKYGPLDLTNNPSLAPLASKRPSNCKYEPSTAIDNRSQIRFNAPSKRTHSSSLPVASVAPVTAATATAPLQSAAASATTSSTAMSQNQVSNSNGNSNDYFQIQSRRSSIPNISASPASITGSYTLPPPPPPTTNASQQQQQQSTSQTSTPDISFGPGHNSKLNRSLHGIYDNTDESKNCISIECNALLLNLALSDSLLNLHKDHNFDSCTLCVCNNSIKDSASHLYLIDSGASDNETQFKCNCGFSAVVNRRMSQFAGLFYEDELEVIGEPYESREIISGDKSVLSLFGNLEPGAINESTSLLLEILKSQCSYTIPSASIFSKCQFDGFICNSQRGAIINGENGSEIIKPYDNCIVKSDSCAITALILLAGKDALDTVSKVSSEQLKSIRDTVLHSWQFSNSPFPSNNHDTVRFLRKLQPLLQESVQKKPTKMWEVTYSVSGPLTWRQFHRLAGRGAEDQCEPQPIPSLLVGHNREWVGIAPYALKMWDQLYLEPYSTTRDVAYLVLSPGSQFLMPRVKTYFRELSNTYEFLRLGKHLPATQDVRDGIFRISKSHVARLADEPTDEWFNRIPDASLAAKLKIYSQFCTAYLIPVIKNAMGNIENLSKTSNVKANVAKTSIPSPSNADGNFSSMSTDVKNDESIGETSQQPTNTSTSTDDSEDDSNKQPAFVIYIVEPFTFNSVDAETYRLACSGLLRCFSSIYKAIPDLQKHLNLQIVSLDSILNHSSDVYGCTRKEQLRSLSFSVFGQCRKTIHPLPLCKSLTGFGPAASLDHFMKRARENGNPIHSNRFFCPPYILAPLKDKQTELGEMFGERREKSQILFCSYCLTEDQRWLVASCANDKGDILETTVINITIPNRTKRKDGNVKKLGINKLMEFLIHVMSESLEPWRLVIGKLGRIGHGELREWASYLSKKALLKATTRLKEKCEQCKSLSYFEVPSILSACLVSLEPDTSLRVFPDQFTSEDRFSSNTCVLSTPEDASSTHLLIFPTSATIQPPSSHSNQNDSTMVDEDILDFGLDVPEGDEDGMNDLFNWGDADLSSPGMQGSEQQGHSGHPDSPTARKGGLDNTGAKGSTGFNDLSDEPLALWLQPLALGYYVSTAQVGRLPRWFWSSCPQMQHVNPAFLKAALLIHTPSVHQHDDLLHQSNRNGHPLDSSLTTDVLRHVLEGYNKLSWLAIDPSTHDRTSCLPIHMQLLLQLYYTLEALS